MIIYSNPQHDPSKEDLDNLALTGDKLKIEKVMVEKFGKTSQPIPPKTMKKIHPDHLQGVTLQIPDTEEVKGLVGGITPDEA